VVGVEPPVDQPVKLYPVPAAVTNCGVVTLMNCVWFAGTCCEIGAGIYGPLAPMLA
jgi:hypothetical protein